MSSPPRRGADTRRRRARALRRSAGRARPGAPPSGPGGNLRRGGGSESRTEAPRAARVARVPQGQPEAAERQSTAIDDPPRRTLTRLPARRPAGIGGRNQSLGSVTETVACPDPEPSCRSDRARNRATPVIDPMTSFDIVVPTVGRSDELVRLLESLTVQSHRSFRVIVIDQNLDGRLLPF